MKRYSTEAFFSLVRAGLWETEARLLPFKEVDPSQALKLAEGQAVVGLVAAGLEHVVDVNLPKEEVLLFVGEALKLEHKNLAMNRFVGEMVAKMRRAGIYTLLVKGQGVAQCYERPLWRVNGDVDLFLNEENYDKAKSFLLPIASSVEVEGLYNKHLCMTVDSWVVELHGNLRSGLSRRIDRCLDDVKKDSFCCGSVRSWINEGTQVFLPSAENEAFYLFTHILQHFYKGGIGLRQLCDWCRLLWTFREAMDVDMLERRISEAGLVSEWKAFGAFAVEYLGMPPVAMPMYSPDLKWKRKADMVCSFILEVGNFGHNRDMSYYKSKPYVVQKAISMGRRMGDLVRHARIFPLDSFRFFPRIMLNGLSAVARGE